MALRPTLEGKPIEYYFGISNDKRTRSVVVRGARANTGFLERGLKFPEIFPTPNSHPILLKRHFTEKGGGGVG